MTVRSIAVLATFVGAALAAAGCSEHLNGSCVVTALCPGQKLPTIDTTFRIDHLTPVYDTTIASFPLLGEEGTLLLANIPGRADIRGILRFDSLANSFKPIGGTLPLDTVTHYPTVAHGAVLWFTVNRGSVATTRGSDQIQFWVYEVDTTADTTVSVLQSMFNTPHFLGASRAYLASGFRDTVNGMSLDTVQVPLDTAAMLAKIRGDRKLRLAIVPILLNSKTDGARMTIPVTPAPYIRYWGNTDSLAKDTNWAHVTSNLRSTTPVTDQALLNRLTRYPLIVRGAFADSADALNIGGIPARRVFLRFELPSRIIDTANVLRATLLLHPRPVPLQLPGDTIAVYQFPVLSSNKVMTPAGATNFIASSNIYNLDSVSVVPSSGAVAAFDFANAVKNWQNISDTLNTRAIVLKILSEGGTPLETSFWSSLAPDTSLRPHVRIQYVKRSPFGVPQ